MINVPTHSAAWQRLEQGLRPGGPTVARKRDRAQGRSQTDAHHSQPRASFGPCREPSGNVQPRSHVRRDHQLGPNSEPQKLTIGLRDKNRTAEGGQGPSEAPNRLEIRLLQGLDSPLKSPLITSHNICNVKSKRVIAPGNFSGPFCACPSRGCVWLGIAFTAAPPAATTRNPATRALARFPF